MIINQEELFVIEYFNDSSLKLLYAPLRMTLFLVTNQTVKLLLSENDSEEKRAVLDYIKSKELLDIQHHHAELSKGMPDLSIAITRDCNMGCIYCHADAGVEGNNNNMEPGHIKQIAQYYFEQVEKDFPGVELVQVSFMGGGEPTVEPKLLRYAVDVCRAEASKIGVKLVFTTAVNGLFGKHMADYLIKEFSSVSLSFDGPAFIQNIHRPMKNGRPSFDRVLATARYFQKKGFSFSLRATISKLSLAHYQELVDFFADEFPGKQVGFEPLNPMGRGTMLDITPSAEEFATGIRQIAEYAATKDIVIGNASLGKFEQIKTVFCNAISAPGFTVTPEGEIWACTRENAPDIFRYGKFDFNSGQVVIDQEKLENLKTINVFNFPECTDCFCKYHCAGDCPDNRYSNLLKCDATKQLGTQILNQLYSSGEHVSTT